MPAEGKDHLFNESERFGLSLDNRIPFAGQYLQRTTRLTAVESCGGPE